MFFFTFSHIATIPEIIIMVIKSQLPLTSSTPRSEECYNEILMNFYLYFFQCIIGIFKIIIGRNDWTQFNCV